jgi:CelD/BcsL family acetyltransferase involved in cellulose biosynthesis
VSRHPLTPEDEDVLTSAIGSLGAFIWRPPARPAPTATEGPPSEGDVTHLIDLRQGADAAHGRWADAARRRVARARRAGAEVVEAAGDDDWEAYDHLYRVSLARWGARASSVYGAGLFTALRARGGRDVRLWLVRVGDEVAAGAVVLTAGRHAAYWHGATDPSRVPGASNLLHWEVISALAGEGIAFYDLSPSGGHDGVARFKATLGGTPVDAPLRIRHRRLETLARRARSAAARPTVRPARVESGSSHP